ncbi:MAG: beta-mannanase [Victivallaceae bacterium]
MRNWAGFESGKFLMGCNYWASHAGTFMWRNWQADTVDQDFAALRANGVEILRVFPLWPDFQPITKLREFGGNYRELRMNEAPFPDTEIGRAGVEASQLDNFRTLADLAAKHELKLVVGLVTGWMSGRLYTPPAFNDVDVLTDPEAIRWQVRFVRCFVRELKDHAAIVGWDLGNECNCMGNAPTNAAAWLWSNAIASAIRMEDRTRPVVSGMHSLQCDERAIWRIVDQGELMDVLTTHPYPWFTPHCEIDRVNMLRNAFHATAESRLYADVGGVPCFVEEAGNLGPMLSGEETAASYLRNMLWNSWAHDCRGLMWWCAHDQTELRHAPYDWVAMERELGMLDVKRKPKQPVGEFAKFRKMLDSLPFAELPEFRRDAVVILTAEQDQWGAAYSSFILAKQAGFDVEFQTANQPLKEAKLYILPSVGGMSAMPGVRYDDLLAKVRGGATLLVTLDGGVLQPFNSVFGVDVDFRYKSEPYKMTLVSGEELALGNNFRYAMKVRDAAVLGTDDAGSPVFTMAKYGKGKALVLMSAVEVMLANRPGVFADGGASYHRIYRMAAEAAGIRRLVRSLDSQLTVTEHRVSEGEWVVVVVNNTPERRKLRLEYDGEVTVLMGKRDVIEGNDGVVLKLKVTAK